MVPHCIVGYTVIPSRAILLICSYLVDQIDSAAVTILPLTNTICTSLAWLSSKDIAVGHSNGFLAVYSILPQAPPESLPAIIIPSNPSSSNEAPQSSALPSSVQYHSAGPPPQPSLPPPITVDSDPPPPTPWLIHRLHQSYILSLTTTYPSCPTLLCSSSISGHTRLTDLSHPSSSTVQSRRTNTPSSTLCYHPALYGCVFPDDGRENISFTGLRFWGNNIGVAEARGSALGSGSGAIGGGVGLGGVMTLDVGKVHPSMVWGCCDGSVVVSNPIKKVLRASEKVWQLVVCKNEWVRRPKSTPAETAQSEEVGQEGEGRKEVLPPGRRGMSRITEGYKVQQADLEMNPAEKNIVFPSGRSGRGSQMTTIFEAETACTAVCWNPNLHCGGWLAMAWANGLVRVEDVAI